MSGFRFVDGELRGAAGESVTWPELALFGDPVGHSLSPRLHAAALVARDIDARYLAIRVAAADLSGALEAARAGGTKGLNLTVPLKERVLDLVSRSTDECRRIGAANTLVIRQEEWVAHNTDARGFAMGLEHSLGTALRSTLSDCVVLGGGGAARAVADALQALGASRLTVAVRNPARANWVTGTGACLADLEAAPIPSATLIVNCTPLGLSPADPAPIEPHRIGPSCFVSDLCYGPHRTALISGALARGARVQDGLPMLVAQAALAFSIWYGALPPVADMAGALDLDW